MTAINMPLDIANDLLCTSRDYVRSDPKLAAQMARRAFQIGSEFDLDGQLDHWRDFENTDRNHDVETSPSTRPRSAGYDHADDGDVWTLIILLRLRRSIRSGPQDKCSNVQA